MLLFNGDLIVKSTDGDRQFMNVRDLLILKITVRMENQGEKRHLKQMATLGVRSSDSKRNKTIQGMLNLLRWL